MKHVLKASSRLKVPSEALTGAPVWVSDALLNETFERFSRGCRRHGSHVPGPLEARRRATKRKNTSIAYTGSSPVPLDAAALFGPGQGGWWKQPPHELTSRASQKPSQQQGLDFAWARRQEEPPPTTLSSWFRKPPRPSPPQLQVEDLWSDLVLTPAQLEAQVEVFKKNLLNTHDLNDVRSLVRELKLDVPQRLRFLDLALQHILQSKWPLDATKDFMFDSTLNPPGSRSFRVMTNALKEDWLDYSTRVEVLEAICHGISLGLASVEDVKYTVTSIRHFKMSSEIGAVRPNKESTTHRSYSQVLSAIEESKVLSLSDLGREFVKTWVHDILKNVVPPAAALLLWKLGCFLEESKKKLASSILTKSFSPDLSKDVLELHKANLLAFLKEIPASVLPHAVTNTTQALIASAKDKQSGYDPISRWHDFLGSVDASIIIRTFGIAPASVWQTVLLQPGQRDECAKRALSVAWIAVSMSRNEEYAEKHLRKLGLGAIFKNIYSGTNDNGTRDVLAQVLETLQSLPLPNTHLLLTRLRFITDHYVVVPDEKFALQAVKDNFSRRFAVLESDRDYDLFRAHFNDALVDLAESVNKDLPLFLHIARRFIEKDEAAFLVVTRILKHNLAFHDALSRAWPKEKLPGRFDASVSENYRSKDSAQPPSLDPRQVLDVMNHLAVSFATSTAITPRQAVRRVYWCFETLHRYGAPVERPITRALWHAGVTRYHKAGGGTATTLLRWIVKQVRIVEGDKFANMLLASASFRAKMEQKFEELEWLRAHELLADLQSLDPGSLSADLTTHPIGNCQA